ncbi:MAG: NAD(P)/FAD-dependent oxidoreductase [Micromonosporaceae bacterium]
MDPSSAKYVIIGAGLHGLSTAWRLAVELRRSGRGDGRDIVVLDKGDIGAGASGIACGVVRNNYFQPAMRELMAHSVSIWEQHARQLSYHPVGYLQVSPEAMRDGVRQIHQEQRAIGYPSTLIEGAAECQAYLKDLFGDWRAPGATSVLHEQRGGYANNMASVRGLAELAQAEGVRLRTRVEVTGLDLEDGTAGGPAGGTGRGTAGGAVRAVRTDQGTIHCDQLVIAVGPWAQRLWAMLRLPATVTARQAPSGPAEQRPMWTYWMLQEGVIRYDPALFTDSRGNHPPVIHVDSDTPLHDEHGELVTDQMWGIYYKPDPHFGGVQGGCAPRPIPKPAETVAVDPYGANSRTHLVDEQFIRMWTAGLAHCHERFAGARGRYLREPSGGLGCFTPDSFPVFDRFRQNAYVIADSNHGYKMIGVGALVAKELLDEPQPLLEPFRFSRYERGELHPVSSSPFPWS